MNKFLFPLLALATFLFVQSASAAVVGYINQTFAPGYNFFGNQLDDGVGNTANTLFPAGSVPVGTALTQWDPGTLQYRPYSLFNGTTWSINYQLALGQGAVLYTSSYSTNTFVGTVSFSSNSLPANGLFLASSVEPLAPAPFSAVVGREPANLESVSRYDQNTASFKTVIFDAGTSQWWDDSFSNPVPAPGLAIMEAAFVGLGSFGGVNPPLPPPVPEPGVGALLLVCGTVFKLGFSRRKG